MSITGTDAPIGVFDSGVGGISTLCALEKELPNEHFLYIGDTANAPYGTKQPEEILGHIRRVMDALLSRNVKAIVIACNTATSVAAQTLRSELSLPIIGIEPALKPASELRHGGQVLVLATPVTLQLQKYRLLQEKYGEGSVPVPCPGLMDLVEREDFTAARRYLAECFAQFDLEHVDAIVLGCTHYVFLRPVLSTILPPHIAVIDGNAGTARQLRRILTVNGLLSSSSEGSVELHSTGAEDQVLPVMHRLHDLGMTIA